MPDEANSATPLFGSGDPFPELEAVDPSIVESSLRRFDRLAGSFEGAGNLRRARSCIMEARKDALLEVHRILFEGRPGAGCLRQVVVSPPFPGQDCPEPGFIERSLQNLEAWLSADSFSEIHAIQQVALVLTRLIDVWPFEFGNRATALVFSNFFLSRAGCPAFFLTPEEIVDFDDALSQAILMRTEPLVQLIHKCIQRELNLAEH